MAAIPKKFIDSHDPTFAILVQEVTRAIERNKDGRGQKEHVEDLLISERLFHESILKTKISTEIYKKFIQLIRLKNKNILSARPYFRETSETFSREITPAIKSNNPQALKKFNINYHFVKFVKNSWIGLWGKKNEELFQRVERARTILIENNMPLAINRAKIFYRKTPKGHLSFMDMIEISALGLAAGIDKYCGPYKKNYLGVCIGRIVGNLIDAYSETTIHFYPNDRRILYRANSIRGRQGIHDIVELTAAVNASFAQDLKDGKTAPPATTKHELSDLLAASSMVSADSNSGEEGYGVYTYTADSGENAEEIYSQKEQLQELSKASKFLPIINRKILRLKGIRI